MIIKQIHVKNYRSIKDETLVLGDLTALVGRNGSGKSNFLKALELFFEPSAKTVEDADHHGGDGSSYIEIELTFGEVVKGADDRLDPYVRDGVLVVTRRFGPDIAGKYYGSKLEHLEFAKIRNLSGRQEQIDAYNAIRDHYGGHPYQRSHQGITDAMEAWEAQNPDQCEWISAEVQFLGFREVGRWEIEKYIRLVSIPAVRDASEEAADKGSSAVKDLMDAIVRANLEGQSEWQEFMEETKKRYSEIVEPSSREVVARLQEDLTEDLQRYAPGNEVDLALKGADATALPLPTASLSLTEGGYRTTVDRTGHGTQRALVFALLGTLAANRAEANADDQGGGQDAESGAIVPTLVLLIEEPELYQHPTRQRHIAKTLRDLTTVSDASSAPRAQVVFATHSPHFVSIDRADDVRLIRKTANRESTVASVNLDECAKKLQDAVETKQIFTGDSLRPRLTTVATPSVNEGFFAGAIVLVEGETDRTVLKVVAERMGHDFDELDISVVACNGKLNIDRPLVVFRNIGIPVYIVWDGDKGGKDGHPETNRSLTRLLGANVDEYPCFVADNGACFSSNMEETLKLDWSVEAFENAFRSARADLGFEGKAKNPAVYEFAVRKAYEDCQSSPTIERIVELIIKLRNS